MTALSCDRSSASVFARLRLALRLASAVLPGVALCGGVAAAAELAELAEQHLTGAAWLESLMLAIVIGAGVRTAWRPSGMWQHGIHFSAKTLLEIAVALLGASVSAGAVAALGFPFLLGIVAVVALAIPAGYAIGRMCRLPPRMAMLVACGNAICGNSAVVAVAPAIRAEAGEVAAAIAFTALFGVLTVFLLPFCVPLLHASAAQYGALAGLTVYAVPQVLAATAPLGFAAMQLGTLVKLVRVLMLGLVVMALSVLFAGRGEDGVKTRQTVPVRAPWFIMVFLALAALRSLDVLPEGILPILAAAASVLTVMSMAALGLSTDLLVAARAGGGVVAAVLLSLLMLGVMGWTLIWLAGL